MGVALIIVGLVVVVGLGYLFYQGSLVDRDMLRDFDAASPCRATVISFSAQRPPPKSNFGPGGSAYVDVRSIVLRVQPVDGAPHEATVKWEVNLGHGDRLVEGASLAVRVAENRPELIFPEEDWLTLQGTRYAAIRYRKKSS